MEKVLNMTERAVDSPRETDSSPVSKTAGILMDIKLQVRVLFGRTSMRLRDLLRLSAGSVVELDRAPDDIVELVINDRVIARGQVVVVEGCYGIRVTEISRRKGDSSEDLAILFRSLGR